MTLDINGGMRIGQLSTGEIAAITCDASKLGTLVFDIDANVVKICKSIGWSRFDSIAPSGGDFSIPSSTNLTSVTLSITCPTDNASDASEIEMYISGTGLSSGGNVWETCTTSKGVVLTSGDGIKNVTVKFRDKTGNETGIVSRSSTYTATTYSWYTGEYGSCSANPAWGVWHPCSVFCGGGIQHRNCYDTIGTKTRTVYCRRSDGSSVSDSYCSGSKPASSTSCSGSCVGPSSQTCNTLPCILPDPW